MKWRNQKGIPTPKSKVEKELIVCFVVCDNGFLQIFYNCSNVEEIFSWH